MNIYAKDLKPGMSVCNGDSAPTIIEVVNVMLDCVLVTYRDSGQELFRPMEILSVTIEQ